MGTVIPFCPRVPRRIDWPVAGFWMAAMVTGMIFWAWVIDVAVGWLS